MAPVPPFNNAPHPVLAKMGIASRDVGNLAASVMEGAHFHDLSLGGLRRRCRLPSKIGKHVATSASRHAIPDVVEIGSRIKMDRIDAARVVTMMKRPQLAKRLSAPNLKRDAMGQKRAVIVRNNAVAAGIEGARPLPALILGKPFWELKAEVTRKAAKRLDFADALKDNTAGAAWPRFQVHGPDHAASRLLRQGSSA